MLSVILPSLKQKKSFSNLPKHFAKRAWNSNLPTAHPLTREYNYILIILYMLHNAKNN